LRSRQGRAAETWEERRLRPDCTSTDPA
jgi:hypothetical protein